MNIDFVKFTKPTAEIAAAFNNWENDPMLIPLIRPNPNAEALLRRDSISVEELDERIIHNHIYLIYLQEQLVGAMDYQIDPVHLHKRVDGTAWIGIIIGEELGRGKGVGAYALQYLEQEIKLQGLKRMELGVFEFNTRALKLYQNLGYTEIVRIDAFTYWEGKMWQDIRMEKYL